MLLSDAIAAYVAERAQTGEITPVTAEQFAWRLGLLARHHPGLAVDQLTRAHVVDWQRTVGGQRPATRRGYLSTLKVFCRWAVDQGLLPVDPTVRLPRVKDKRPKSRHLSAAKLARLELVLPDERARLIVALMHQLGLRCVEVARLTVADWDRCDLELHIVGKGDEPRDMQVLDDLADMLDRWCVGRSGSMVGISAERISLLVSRWMGRAGIKTGRYDGTSAHALRHTAAGELLDGCDNVRIVQEFLGHASLATTQRYLRPHTKAEMRAAQTAAARRQRPRLVV